MTSVQTTLFAAATTVLICSHSSRAYAEVVLDQVSPHRGSSLLHKSDQTAWQQGVIAGQTGLLTRVDYYSASASTGETHLTLYDGSPWQSGSPAALFIFEPTSTGWTSVDVSSANFHVTAQHPFTIGLRGFGANTPLFAGNSNFGYTAGRLYLNGAVFPRNVDMEFMTYVDVVPEPATLTATLLAAACIGVRPRRR